jgi:prepilin-type processing-associated H-X9-DG protein/prepilin-type N-terminal cleavage/methylation domain-containing protein
MNTQRTRRAFTMVELLTVIVVIVILAALLFPVVSSARRRASTATCLSNVRQIGQAMAMYVSDYDSTYPVSLSADSNWVLDIQPYIGGKGGAAASFEATLYCPLREIPALYSNKETNFPPIGYAYNQRLNAFVALTTQGPVYNGKAEPTLNYPALTVTVFEARVGIVAHTRPDIGVDLTANGDSIIVGSPAGIQDQIAELPEGGRRHNGGANYSFADGHTKWFLPEKLGTTAASDGSTPGFGL